MAHTTTTTRTATTTRSGHRLALRWHPARLLYIFVVTLVVGILYSEAQALLAGPSSALDPAQLQTTFFWHLALIYPAYFAPAVVLAVGAAVLGWRVERRYAAVQAEAQREETVAAVVRRVRTEGALPTSATSAPRDFPPRAPGFVGRADDLAQATSVLRQGQAVAVVGMGGLGKSSLAAEVVHALAAEPDVFPGGITWVRCDERTGPEGVIWIEDQLLVAWGAALLPEATARAKTSEEALDLREQALRKRLGASTAAPMVAKLALLDNVEPALPLGRLLDVLQPLGMALLITTRAEPTSLHIRLLSLDVLGTQSGIALFAERYENRGGMWDTPRDSVAAGCIVDALGGLPLAIELAAARAARTRLPLASLAQELSAPDALARLNDPRDPSSGVRYSLRKTLLALTPSQRVRFAALGLPDGSDWALTIIERMFAGVPPDARSKGEQPDLAARADLEALVAYSLVSLSTPMGSDAPRVRLHPLVRELAREEWATLPQLEQEAALKALLVGIEDRVERYKSRDLSEFTVVVPDDDLIASALRTAVAQQTDLKRVLSIITDWADYLWGRNVILGSEMHRLHLEVARALHDRREELTALGLLSQEAGYLGQRDESIRFQREALAVAQALGDHVQILISQCYIAQGMALRGHTEEAERIYAEMTALAREMGDALTDWAALNALGELARSLDRLEEARQWYSRAISSARAAGQPAEDVLTQHNLGLVYARMGDIVSARRIHEGLLAITREHGVSWGESMQLIALGELDLMAGDMDAASDHLTAALPFFERRGGAEMAAQVHGDLALVAGLQAQRAGDQHAAELAFEEAVHLFDQIGHVPDVNDQRSFAHRLLASVQKHGMKTS